MQHSNARAAILALRALLWAAAGLVAGETAAQTGGGGERPAAPADTVLANYVARSDPSFAWHERATYWRRGAEIVELTLHSQTWRDTLWKHQLVLIKPRTVATPEHALLIIGGGRWRDEYEAAPAGEELPDGSELFLRIADRFETIVVVLGQVPHQPLFDRTEDQLIAYTFDQYLKTGDENWPLLLPMVKSAVRAMDAGAAAARREWGTPLESFTVLGGSKRGWTTWLVGAVDERAVALAPAVLDALDMERHFPRQTAVWGVPSVEIAPYTDLGLHEVLGSADGAGLRRIVDPYEYRASLTQPKLVVLATNDAYFPVDSANLYWDDLPEPKYLLYLPNDEHSIEDYRRLIASVGALHDAAAGAATLPDLAWEYRWGTDAVVLCVRSDPAPRTVQLWTAESSDRDFRDAVWNRARAARGGAQRFEIPRPSAGFSAVFAEIVYGSGRSAHSFSTNLAVLASAENDDLGPLPRGEPGVCEAER